MLRSSSQRILNHPIFGIIGPNISVSTAKSKFFSIAAMSTENNGSAKQTAGAHAPYAISITDLRAAWIALASKFKMRGDDKLLVTGEGVSSRLVNSWRAIHPDFQASQASRPVREEIGSRESFRHLPVR